MEWYLGINCKVPADYSNPLDTAIDLMTIITCMLSISYVIVPKQRL